MDERALGIQIGAIHGNDGLTSILFQNNLLWFFSPKSFELKTYWDLFLLMQPRLMDLKKGQGLLQWAYCYPMSFWMHWHILLHLFSNRSFWDIWMIKTVNCFGNMCLGYRHGQGTPFYPGFPSKSWLVYISMGMAVSSTRKMSSSYGHGAVSFQQREP